MCKLIENAVLLDTEVHEHHSNNPNVDLIAFVRRLYALGKNFEGNIALYRITVEEMYEGAKATNNKRFHNLKYVEQIKKIGAVEGLTTGENIPGAATLSGETPISGYNVSDLYRFVKRYDADFNVDNAKISEYMPDINRTPKIRTPKIYYMVASHGISMYSKPATNGAMADCT